MTAIDLKAKMPGHVDIPRLRKGKVGGFFWYVSGFPLCRRLQGLNDNVPQVCIRLLPGFRVKRLPWCYLARTVRTSQLSYLTSYGMY